MEFEQSCCVCGEQMDGDNVSTCNFCGGKFHMAWTTGLEMKDCGRHWVNDLSCGLVFACAKCVETIGKQPRAPELGEEQF